MSDTDLRARIKEMLVKNLMLQVTPEQIGDDLPLFGANGLGLDSIDALELVVLVEERFGVTIPDEEVGKAAFASIDALADFVLHQAPTAESPS